MTIYTKTGDDGLTTLEDKRVPKCCVRAQALGDIEELISVIAVAASFLDILDPQTHRFIENIQSNLFFVRGSLLDKIYVYSAPVLTYDHLSKLESKIDFYEEFLPPMEGIILPSGHIGANHLVLSYSVCRRAERWMVALHQESFVAPEVMAYLNRLSHYLYTLARFVNMSYGIPEIKWTPTGIVYG